MMLAARGASRSSASSPNDACAPRHGLMGDVTAVERAALQKRSKKTASAEPLLQGRFCNAACGALPRLFSWGGELD
jgi:hypothetical protein